MLKVTFYRFSDVSGIPNVRGDIETNRCWRHLPVPSGASPFTRPPPQLRRRLALHQGDLEVRTNQRLLQRPNTVSPTCNAQHLPSYAHLGEIHEQRLNLSDGKTVHLYLYCLLFFVFNLI